MFLSHKIKQDIQTKLNQIYNLLKRQNADFARATVLLVYPCDIQNKEVSFHPHDIDFYILEEISLTDSILIVTRDLTVNHYDFELAQYIPQKQELTFQQIFTLPSGITTEVIARNPEYNAMIKIK